MRANRPRGDPEHRPAVDRTPTFSLENLRLVFELAPVGMCVTRQRVIQTANEQLGLMFGYGAKELEGRSVSMLYPSAEEFEATGRRGHPIMLASGRYSDDRIMRRRDGELFWCHVAGRSLEKRDPFACAVWIFEDLSAKRVVSAELTTREREIAQFLVTGRSSKEIGRQLDISHRTVEAHQARLIRKLKVRSHAELIARLVGVI